MNIGADATIVSAAGNYAQAQVPFSMKGMADGFVTEYGNLMDTISTSFEASMNEINGVNDEVQQAINSLNKSLNDGTIDSRERRDEMQAVLDGYRNELKSIGKFGEDNKKKREDLLYEVNKYIKDNESIASGYNELLTTIELKKHSPELTGAANLALIGEVAKYFDGKDTDGDFEINRENGELSFSYTYTSPDGTVTRFENERLEDLNDKIKNKDTGAVTSANTIFNDIRDMSLNTEGLTWEWFLIK